MNRLLLASALLTLATAGAYAAGIGFVQTPVVLTGLNANLATGKMPCINAGCTPNITTTNTLATTPPAGSAVDFSAVLFNSAEVPFDIASGGADNPAGTGNTSDIWTPGNPALLRSVTEDVGNFSGSTPGASGLYNVDQIWTMLNDELSAVGYQGITLVLNGFNPNTSSAVTETITLENGIDYRSIGNGSSLTGAVYPVSCDVANQSGVNLGVNCTGQGSATTPSSGTDSRSGLSSTAGVSVTVYNDVFTTSDPAGDNYWLDVQNIALGNAFVGNWLNSIQVVSNGTSGTNEATVLTAITVDQVPEPSTVLLFGSGIAGFLVLKLRRSKKA